MVTSIAFNPLLPVGLLAVLGGVILMLIGLALYRGLPGWWLRMFAAAVVLLALFNPSWKQEDREPLTDVAFVVVDRTSSQKIDGRDELTEATLEDLRAELEAIENLETVVVPIEDGKGAEADRGTRLMTGLAKAAAEHAEDRIAGAILLTDGRVHDPATLSKFPAPVHSLLTGDKDDWDRRLVIETAPAFAIVGEAVEVKLKIEDLGSAPSTGERAELFLSLDGGDPVRVEIPVGRSVTVPFELSHGGTNILEITTPQLPDELTERNNAALLSINGIRDRLRVLLVSGEPHAGERTWRNLLKADSSVDLVHFTILRPPQKQDGVPVFELSLIAFPTRELFMDKVSEFDLIIFDRYRRRGVLPNLYLENVVNYIREGGAVLVASGEAFAGAESLYRTPLRQVLPAVPTTEVIEEGFRPDLTELGERHPVTAGLVPGRLEDGSPAWGRWFRLIDTVPERGHTIMSGASDKPLLILDRPDEGRIAMLASDHAWLWSRGFEGGGPQSELLRRLAHWLMKEPELEEEVLSAETAGEDVIVTRRSLEATPEQLEIISPSGERTTTAFTSISPGQWQAQFAAAENGLYRLSDGELTGVAAVGPAAPKEFENPVSTPDILAPLVKDTRGGNIRLTDTGTPDIRRVREGRVAAGRNWIGLARRDAFLVRDIRLTPLAPGWVFLLLAGLLMLGAWRIEGR